MDNETFTRFFYKQYYKPYPQNINALIKLIALFERKYPDNRHLQAMNHFLYCLAQNESGSVLTFIYTLLFIT